MDTKFRIRFLNSVCHNRKPKTCTEPDRSIPNRKSLGLFAILLLLVGCVEMAAAQSGKVHRIGLLISASNVIGPFTDAFRRGLRDLGYTEGKNYVLEIRGGREHPDWFSNMAAELVRLKVDIIVTVGSLALRAATRATNTIPIVMRTGGDPVKSGLVDSLARPQKTFADSLKLPYPLLSDFPHLKTIQSYGGLNPDWKSTTAVRSFFLIGQQGIVRGKWQGTTTDVFPSEPILKAARACPAVRSRMQMARTPRLKTALSGIVCFLAALYASAAERPAVTELFKPLNLSGYSPGMRAPEFNGLTADNKAASLAGLRGRVILLNFWASWCQECRAEMPAFERLHREFTPQGLSVVGINVREKAAAVRGYSKELGLTFPLVLDSRGEINAAYGVIGLPTTFLIGRDGRAVAPAVGPREWAGGPARALIQTLLAEPAIPGAQR